MTRLVWDQVEERLYETGIDHGVLYMPSAPGLYDDGVVWNGLISVVEEVGDDATQPYYFDGVKYLDGYSVGDFAATITAFTYPEEFMDFEGLMPLGGGMYVDDQTTKMFGMAYRTLIGNAVEGISFGYRIHLLYNLTASTDSLAFTSNETPEASNFVWTIASVPEVIPNYRPTAHAILDSRYLDVGLLSALEDILYGDADQAPRLPSLTDLVNTIIGWNPRSDST